MTLKQLVEAYDGQIIFNVLRATLGGKEEVIAFSSEDNKAIKDEILAEEVESFTVEVSNNVRTTAKITVVLEGAVSTEDSTPDDTDPATP